MKYADKYYSHINNLMEEVYCKQKEIIGEVARLLVKTIQANRTIWTFGCTHGSMLAAEMYYRAGGLIPVKGIFAPGLWLDQLPVTRTSNLEKLEGYGRVILEDLPLQAQDVLIVSSTSGKNAVPVEVALEGKNRGLIVVAVTSLMYSQQIESGHSSGQKLYDVADIVLDNRAPYGDALMSYPDFPEFKNSAGAVSTITGALILNSIVVETVGLLLDAGFEPPVYVSGNITGGMEANKRAMVDLLSNKVRHSRESE